jgi:hypothetical protein
MAPFTFHTLAAVGFVALALAMVLWRLGRAIGGGAVNFDVNFFFDTGFRNPSAPAGPEYFVDIGKNSHPFVYRALVLFLSGFALLLVAIGIVILKVGIA